MYSLSLFLKKFTIPFFVFITGACVLIIEILATRVLAPYFGNTIFSLSSVLSVVLLALSLGYFFGGKLADKHPNEKLFFGLIAASGVCVIVLHVAGMLFLTAFGYSLSIMQGPIIASALLFFLQNFLLGMLSPFAIKLQTLRLQNQGVGSVSGQIFFWSTLGSIGGSLSAGFLLIPYIGINKIMVSVGFLLIILGAVAMLKIKLWLKIVVAIVLMLFILLFTGSLTMPTGIYAADALYQKVTIYDGQYNGRPARFLLQDRNPSAAAFIDSDELVFGYTNTTRRINYLIPRYKTH